MSQKTLNSLLAEKGSNSKEYKKLSPSMKKAVDNLFKSVDLKSFDFINNFEDSIKAIAKKFRVSEKDLMDYLEREVLSV
jgi:hypothetical protein